MDTLLIQREINIIVVVIMLIIIIIIIIIIMIIIMLNNNDNTFISRCLSKTREVALPNRVVKGHSVCPWDN